MRRFHFERLVLSVCAGVAAITAAVSLPAEIARIDEQGRDDALIFLQAGTTPPQFASVVSTAGIVGQMAQCDDLLLSVYPRLVGEGSSRSVAAACLSRAQAVLDQAPTLSVAHLARAAALWRLGQTKAASQALGQSAVLAPAEGWLAARRLRLAMQMAETGQQAESDVVLIAQDATYHPLLVQLYIDRPQQQGWLRGALQQANPRSQARFLSQLRARVGADIGLAGGADD